jgi:DNA-binding Xre family transcriptional regulator
MKQRDSLIRQLKKLIKVRGMNYASLAKDLNLSEASVKRIFSQKTFTLDRLDQICEILDIDFYELAKLSRSVDSDEKNQFSGIQEKALAEEERLFVLFYMLLSGLKLNEIQRDFQFDGLTTTTLLLKLEKLGLIEYHSDKKIKIMVSRNLQWAKKGPLNSKYESKIKDEFLRSDFAGTFENLKFVDGYFAETDLKLLNRKIEKLISEFKETSEIRSDQKNCKDIWLMIAYRPWIFSIISRYKQK